jgi:hypothetical protein
MSDFYDNKGEDADFSYLVIKLHFKGKRPSPQERPCKLERTTWEAHDTQDGVIIQRTATAGAAGALITQLSI